MKQKRHRSADSGEFVSESTALADPSRHVSEAGNSELTELERAVVEKAVASRQAELNHDAVFNDDALLESDRDAWERRTAESFGAHQKCYEAERVAVDRLIAFRGADECGP